MNVDSLLSPEGALVRTLAPVLICAVAAVLLGAVIRILGGRLLDDREEVNGLARASVVGVVAVGVLLGLGRLVDPTATDTGLQVALAGIIGSLPGLTISFVLLIVALLVAGVLRATVVRVLGAVRPAMARVAGQVVYWTVVILVALIAAEQAGMDVGVLRQLLLIAFAGFVAAVALGLGLSLRPLLGSVIAGRHVDRIAKVGHRVTVGEVAGVVVAVGHVSVTLRTTDGATVDVPHEQFLREHSTTVAID